MRTVYAGERKEWVQWRAARQLADHHEPLCALAAVLLSAHRVYMGKAAQLGEAQEVLS